MDYCELPAPPPLDELIHCFWFLRGAGSAEEPQTIVTDGRIDVVLHLADPFGRIDEAGGVSRQATALLAGQLTAPIRLAPSRMADVVGIRFRTAGASVVFRAPLAEFTNEIASLSDIAPRFATALRDAASRHDNPHARVAALSAVITRFVRNSPDRLAANVVRALDHVDAPGVGALSTRFGVSARTVERRVLDGTGLTPTVLRRALRFRRVFRMLDQTPPGTWAQAAVSAGYFDQAHMIRDFRQFAGATPSEFFRTDPSLAREFIGSKE